MNDSARSAATHGGGPAAVVVVVVVLEVVAGEVLVLVVVVETLAVVAVSEPAGLLVIVVVELLEPQADSASAIASISSVAAVRRIGTCSRPAGGGPAQARLPVSQPMPTNPAHGDLAEAEAIAGTVARRDPLWGPQVVIAAAIVLDLTLPSKLTVGPIWLLPALEALLLLGLTIFAPHARMRRSPLRRRISLTLIGFVSAANIVSLYLLCHFLLHHGTREVNGDALIRSGMALWITNVLLFALWYWELDRGGPLDRALGTGAFPDFLFPQMTERKFAPPHWMPGLVDYLYVSFTNATAFSPTDTMPLSWTAKWLMAAQSLAALVTIGLVVARAVNILG
jgi:hypothetical protein